MGDSKANCTVEVIVSGNVSVYHMKSVSSHIKVFGASSA